MHPPQSKITAKQIRRKIHMIYADNAATTKMSKTAIAAMLPYMEENYGNPSSLYSFGQTAKEALEDARARIAKALNAKTEKSVCLRTKPNKTASSLRRLAAGDKLQVIAVGKTWSKVKDLTTGKTGYVANDYIARV